MRIIEQYQIKDKNDILAFGIVDFNRLNGCWLNARDAINTISSWLLPGFVYTKCKIDNWNKFPKRDDFPKKYHHIGCHEEIARHYWDWFFGVHPNDKLTLSDSPDLYGQLGLSMFWGDIGKVSASTFSMTIKAFSKNDIWISLLDDGSTQIILEAIYSPSGDSGIELCLN